MTESSQPEQSPREPLISPKKARQRAWIWFFAVLSVLTLTAICLQVWYNVRNQLTQEQLTRARDLWNAKGPADYDMTYEIKKMDATETYDVKVRSRRAISVTRDGQPLEERLFRYSEMPSLFGFIEEFLEQDHQPGQPRTFAVANFDPTDGHLLRYVRSVMSKRERQEITVKRFDRAPK
jgi:hypothetical protein